MKNVKVILMLWMAIALVALTACSGGTTAEPTKTPAQTEGAAKTDKKVIIGLTVQNLSNPFFIAMSKGAADSAKSHGAEVITVSADGDLAKQTAQIEDFITRKVSMILLNPVDSKGIAGAVAEAKAAGIPVIAVDAGADGGISSFVESDNFLAGKLAGEYVVKRLGGKGNVVILSGNPVTVIKDRVGGFEEAIKNSPEIKVVATQNGQGSRETSVTVMENILQANGKGKIDAVFAINDPSGIGAKIAAEQAGRDKEMIIVGIDGAPDAVTALKEKRSFVSSSAQHPYDIVQKGIEVGFKILKGEKVDEHIKIPVELITQDNVDSYKGW
jgi:ribose transport system substrate-binding protein